MNLPDFTLPEGGKLLSVGIDLTEVDRIRTMQERHGDRFIQRIYTEGEAAYCLRLSNPWPSLAARFAAKEAVAKAFTTGIGKELGWRSIEVCKSKREHPYIRLDSSGTALLHALGGTAIRISLTHTALYGQAIALILQ